jgi:hypothetical protein
MLGLYEHCASTISERCLHRWFKSAVSLGEWLWTFRVVAVRLSSTIQLSVEDEVSTIVVKQQELPITQRHTDTSQKYAHSAKTAVRTEHYRRGGNICRYLQRCRPLYAEQLIIYTFIFCCKELMKRNSQLSDFRLPPRYK